MLVRLRCALLAIVGFMCLGAGLTPANAAAGYLEPERAFHLTSRMIDATTIEVSYAIAEGYYMYRDRFQFSAVGAQLGTPAFPPGRVKFDDTFQKSVETYHDHVSITLPVRASSDFTLTVTGQGCADTGLCYLPMTAFIQLSPTPNGSSITGPAATSGGGSSPIEVALHGGSMLVILPMFFMFGLGLAFTPCVLPMMPILSSIIVGDGAKVTRRRALLLAATYSIGMALVYTVFGIVAGLAGQGLAAAMQNPLVLGAFALVLVGLSLSMLGAFEVQMPGWIQARIAEVSSRQQSGNLIGVFVMGALSALIVGPCVAAPLAGALLYISQSGDIVIGGSALFFLAAGMSVPLLAISVSAGALLPRAGAWMDDVKRLFGVILIAVAWWTVSPLFPTSAQMAGLAAIATIYAGYLLWPGKHSGRFGRIAGLVLLVAGIVESVGAATGANDVFAPLTAKRLGDGSGIQFIQVHSNAELDASLSALHGRVAMLDFYADWCVSCKEMESTTLTDPQVKHKLGKLVLLQADVTGNTLAEQALLKRFQLFGPPAIVFFDGSGTELANSRVIVYQNADDFRQAIFTATN
ncbi:MAG: protein-disulfide reductase DsbD [Herminiimonas sp.]|nr:protein-disulfide reductase DsbD [Herminiimonas sp.]